MVAEPSGVSLIGDAKIRVQPGTSPIATGGLLPHHRGMSKQTELEKQDMENGMETNSETTTPTGPAPKRLSRTRDDRMVAGVAGGIAKHFNIDPVIVRIAFVATTFAGGFGVLLYLVGWLLVPEEGESESLGSSATAPLRTIPRWLIAGFLGIAAVALISDGFDWGNGPFFWSVALIGGGVLLYRMDAAPPKPPAPSAEEGEPPTELATPDTAAATTTPLPAATMARRRPPKQRSHLGRYTFATLLLVLGVTAMLQGTGAFSLRAEQYSAFALFVVGGGLLIGTFFGRSRSLIFLGLMIVPIAMISTLVRVPLEGGVGDRTYKPTSVREVNDVYRLGIGTMTIDLRDLKWGDQPVEIMASVVAGRLSINVPNNVTVEFDGRVGAGHIFIFNSNRDGLNASLASTFEGSSDGGTVVIDAEVSFGEIYVTANRPNQKGAR